MSEHITYSQAGVDIEAGNEAVRRLAPLAKATFDSRVITDIGGFAGLYSIGNLVGKDPILVSSTDGVGTKLKVAIMADRHETIGQDLVAMSVNDILAQGARPLFFLDYLATSKVEPAKIAQIVGGIAAACKLSACALIGGETAEMPDFYQAGDYDLAGFALGLVDRDEIIDGSHISLGHKIIGLASSGLHSNSFSLVRKIIFEKMGLKIDSPLLKSTVAEELLVPTKIYVPAVLASLRQGTVTGLAHITGGGLLENIPRILPDGTKAVLDSSLWEELPIFGLMREETKLPKEELYKTFNMGLGMIMVVEADKCEPVINTLRAHGETAQVVGEIVRQKKGQPQIEIL